MDLKEIIKWFIPCFHILQKKMDLKVIVVCLFLFFNLCSRAEASVSVNNLENTKNLDNNYNNDLVFNQSEVLNDNKEAFRSEDSTVGKLN